MTRTRWRRRIGGSALSLCDNARKEIAHLLTCGESSEGASLLPNSQRLVDLWEVIHSKDPKKLLFDLSILGY